MKDSRYTLEVESAGVADGLDVERWGKKNYE